MVEAITIRRSTDADRRALVRLAELDGRRPPEGEAMLAFIGDELRAAVLIDGGAAMADPFRRTGDLVELLRLRVRQAGAAPDRRGRGGRRRGSVRFAAAAEAA
jgi:hypothetical protein